MGKTKDGISKRVSSFLILIFKRDENKLRRMGKKENLTQVIELNRETQEIDAVSGLLDVY